MKYIKNTYLQSMPTLFMFVISLTGYSQNLKIGDPAPKLTPFEWIKGTPVTEFRKGTPYVVEFGATWCKPCAKAIPELTALAKKYDGRAKVIGIFVQEINYEPLSTPNPKYIDRVKEYVEKQGEKMEYHVAVDGPEKPVEKNWIDAIGQSRGVPQTVVIDKEGRIAGYFVGANISLVEQFLASIVEGTYDLEVQIAKENKKTKKESYDRLKPLYIDGNGGNGNNFVGRSILTKSKGEIVESPTPYIDSYRWINTERWINYWKNTGINPEKAQKHYEALQGRVQTINTTLSLLYRMAYSDTLRHRTYFRMPGTKEYMDTLALPEWKSAYARYWHEPILEVSDKEPFEHDSRVWKNMWNYALNVPKEKATAHFLQKAMQRDLAIYFGYDVTVETREMPCWFLKAKPGAAEKLATKTPGANYNTKILEQESGAMRVVTNGDVRDFIFLLDHVYTASSGNRDKHVINRTGINYKIDYQIPKNTVDQINNKDFEGYRRALEAHLGLYLEEGTKPMKVVVIRDPKQDM